MGVTDDPLHKLVQIRRYAALPNKSQTKKWETGPLDAAAVCRPFGSIACVDLEEVEAHSEQGIPSPDHSLGPLTASFWVRYGASKRRKAI